MKIRYLYFLFFIIIIVISCKKDKAPFNYFEKPNLYFDGRGIVIDWEKTDIPGFKYYEVLRSVDGMMFNKINYETTYWFNHHGGLFNGDIDNANTDINNTSFVDVLYPLADTLYYKIAAFGDEIYLSDKVYIIPPKPFEFDFKYDEIYLMPEEKEILILNLNWDNSYVHRFDYKKNLVKSSLYFDIETSGYVQGFGKYNNNYEFYFHDGDVDSMRIFDVMDFNLISSFYFSSSHTHLLSDFSRYMYYEYNGDIKIIDRETLSSELYNTVYFIDDLYIMNGLNKLVGFTDDGILIFETGSTGNIINESYTELDYADSYKYVQNTKYIYGGSYNNKKIINLETWQENSLMIEDIDTTDFNILHAKNDILYAFFNNFVYCYSINDFELIEEFPVRVNPSAVFSDNENLLLFSKSDFDNKTILEKMLLTERLKELEK